MARKFYTLDDLYNFCRENRFESFSSEKQGAPLIVQSFGTFEADSKNTDGLMSVKLKSCHTGISTLLKADLFLEPYTRLILVSMNFVLTI